MTAIWTEWNELRHEWLEGNAKQEFIINKMERVVVKAIACVAELETQAERYKAGLLDLAIEIGPCRCGPEYTGRGLIAPGCAWHQSSTPEILEEAGLLAAYQARLDAALAAREE